MTETWKVFLAKNIISSLKKRIPKIGKLGFNNLYKFPSLSTFRIGFIGQSKNLEAPDILKSLQIVFFFGQVLKNSEYDK